MKAIIIIFAAATMLGLASCQTAPRNPEAENAEYADAYQSIGPYEGGELILPGIYEQKIEIEPSRGGSFQFLGFLRRDAEKIDVSGLSPFSTTMFRIQDWTALPPRAAKIEIFVPELESRRGRLVDFYASLRPLLTLRDSAKSPDALVAKRHPDGRPWLLLQKSGAAAASGAKIWIDAYSADAGGVPDKIRIVTPAWTARISLRRYEANR